LRTDFPSVTLRLPAGDQVTVALQGAQVLSWQTAEGKERLYLSPNSLTDGRSAIRGGVPVCFPQFNQRVLGQHTLPKHGFARNMPWQLIAQKTESDGAKAHFCLVDSAATQAIWPCAFQVDLTVQLQPGQLCIQVTVRNTGQEAWPFALALHSYLAVDAIDKTPLSGLQGAAYWDAVTHLHDMQEIQWQGDQALTFNGQTDRVYSANPQQPLTLDNRLHISQSDSFPETVVWNPGAEVCAALADMPADGYKHMLCVEAAAINTPVLLQPGATWTGWQQLSLSSPHP
jgi:glucose-6-phosphate 1-epimerase